MKSLPRARYRSVAALAAAFLCSGCILSQLGGKRSSPASPTDPTAAPAVPTEDNDVVAYAQMCKRELGLPATTLPHWNCLDGSELPTTIHGKPLDASNYEQLKKHQVACDLPSWLGAEPCANYGFVQHRALSSDVDAYLICRDQAFTTYKSRAQRLADLKASVGPESFNAYFAFDSLGMIWTSRSTGKTCFFDFTGTVYGGYVPSPDDEHVTQFSELPDPKPPTEFATGPAITQIWQKNARTTWRPPNVLATQDGCIMCHDTGAIKSSPWMAQVRQFAPNPTNVPLLVIGTALAPWREKYPVLAVSTAPLSDGHGGSQPQVCTSCHRIGSQQTCKFTMSYSVGKSGPQVLAPTEQDFFHRVWMPPLPKDGETRTDAQLTAHWQSAYGAHYDRLACCCKNPHAINCTAQDITTSPLAAAVAGTGPETCP